MKDDFRPFDDGATSIGIGELTIEDAGDSVAVYGSLTVEATRSGLAEAERLAAIADAMVAKLRSMDLPDSLPKAAVTTKPNPFAA
jgi:hypothetical protein